MLLLTLSFIIIISLKYILVISSTRSYILVLLITICTILILTDILLFNLNFNYSLYLFYLISHALNISIFKMVTIQFLEVLHFMDIKKLPVFYLAYIYFILVD